MAQGGVNGAALAAVLAGATFVYAGLTGNSVLKTIQGAVKGDLPAPGKTTSILRPIHGQGPANPYGGAGNLNPNVANGGTIPGSAGNLNPNVNGAGLGGVIAADALRYDGTEYHFGGDPSKGEWDCSSLVNKVIGADLGLAIPWYPAGKYTGHGHGPVTADWLGWSGARTIGHSGAVAQPGDLCCWQTHIGIAIGGGQMLSARSEKAHPPTGTGHIDGGGPTGQILFVRRLKAVTGG